MILFSALVSIVLAQYGAIEKLEILEAKQVFSALMLEHLHGKPLDNVGIEGGHLNDMTLYVEEPQTNMNMTFVG